MVHYPVPVHRQIGYAHLVRIGPGGLRLTELLATEIFSLPLYPELTDHEVDRVIEALTVASGSRD
jgi:dTDP-4-amino-4,6-dideoxygalactose transaminase